MARRRGTTETRYRRRSSRRTQNSKADETGVVVPELDLPSGPVDLPVEVTVNELSQILNISHVDAVKSIMKLGIMATVNDVIDFQTAARVAHGFGVKVRRPDEQEESIASQRVGDDSLLNDKTASSRPPIVTILGHVDHGKTTLLDSIRGTKITESEAGGITQGIGAYQAEWHGNTITFIDTPGHAAFTAMRARGAQATDIAVLLVAADDGVMAQTDEAIDHARAAKVPIIIAINKIDAPGADIERVKRQLAEREILVESWGGEVVAVEVSALQNKGIDDLLENIVLVGEIENLVANPDRPGIGVAIEAHIDKRRGPLATIIVRSGTVRTGDNIVVGTTRGRVREMIDGFGLVVTQAGPASPIQIMGLDSLPVPGDRVEVVVDEKSARQLVETRQRLANRRGSIRRKSTMAEVMRKVRSGDSKELNLVLKSGSQGSIDAIRKAVELLATDELQVNIISAQTGFINETDVMLAAASDAIVLGFETFSQPGAVRQADGQGVEIRTYDVIYQLSDDVAKALHGLTEPEEREVILGRAIVQQIFSAGRRDRAAGIRVTDGFYSRSAQVRIIRAGEEIYSGSVRSLRRFKEDVREVQQGFEGGLMVDGFNTFEQNDVLECFEIQRLNR